jgi:transposase
MGTAADEIDRQIKATRDHMDENIGVLEQRAASKAVRYGRIVAIALGVGALAGAGVLVYRRMNQPSRREQLRRMLIDALKDLPDSVRDLPDEVTTRLKKPLPSVKVVVNGEDQATEPGALESIVRKVAPAVVGTASTALIGRFTRPPDLSDERPARSTVPSYD